MKMAPDGAADQEKNSMDHSKTTSSSSDSEGLREAARAENLHLNIGQLKELLDEAFNYKNPKDREGKSQVFLDLLHEAESAEEAEGQELAAGGRRGLRGTRASERSGAGGSLQNICQAVESDSQHHSGGRRRNRHNKGPGSSVSARQREGGSLPCNVNTGWTADWSEGVKRRDIMSTSCETGTPVQRGGIASAAAATIGTQARRQNFLHSASNELPNDISASSASREMNRFQLLVHGEELVCFRQNSSGCDVTDGRRMNEDRADRPERLERFERVDRRQDNTQDDRVSSSTGPSLHYNVHQQIGSTLSGLDIENNNATADGLYRTSASLEVADSFAEGTLVGTVELSEDYPCVQSLVGENRSSEFASRLTDRRLPVKPGLIGVSMNQQSSESRPEENGISGKSSSNKKNNKRKQAAERNVALSCKSEDMPGYRGDTDIDTVLSFIENDGKMKAMGLKKQFPKPKVQEKKQKNLQKSSSLEELSQRNIEDLTQSSETDRSETRRSWGDQVYIRSESQNDLSTRSSDHTQNEEDNNESEFQMVRKKQRRRRGAESSTKRVRRRITSYRSPRRKSTSSVPPSERSADSDLDSVHSLPAHGAHSGPASDSDCDNHGSSHLDSSDATNLTTEDFPSLPAKPDKPDKLDKPEKPEKIDTKLEPKPKTRSKSVGPNTRPPVILLDGDRKPQDSQDAAACEFTFGFEVNMQLLSLTDNKTCKSEELPLTKPSAPVWSTSDSVAAKISEPVPKHIVVSSVFPPLRKPAAELNPRYNQKAKPVPTTPSQPPVPVLKPSEVPRKMAEAPKTNTPWKTKETTTGLRPLLSMPVKAPSSQLPQPALPSPAVSETRKTAPSPWKSCEQLASKTTPTSACTQPSELPVRTVMSNQRTASNQKPQTKPLIESFARAVRPNAVLPGSDTVKPVNTNIVANHIPDKPPKRFNTYIVNNTNKKSSDPATRPTVPFPNRGDDRQNKFGDVFSGKHYSPVAVSTGIESNGPVLDDALKIEEERERRVSDVMTSTDDLETVTAHESLKEEIDHEENIVDGDEGAEEFVDSDVERERNPYYPFANAEHRRLVAFMQKKFDEAVNASDTVYYSEN